MALYTHILTNNKIYIHSNQLINLILVSHLDRDIIEMLSLLTSPFSTPYYAIDKHKASSMNGGISISTCFGLKYQSVWPPAFLSTFSPFHFYTFPVFWLFSPALELPWGLDWERGGCAWLAYRSWWRHLSLSRLPHPRQVGVPTTAKATQTKSTHSHFLLEDNRR